MSVKTGRWMAAHGLVPLIVVATGCGVGQESTASRSAAAYDEAARKGQPVGGAGGHGEHGPAEGASPGPSPGHGTAEAPAHEGHAADRPGSPADHSRMPEMDHGPARDDRGGHAGMPGMAHGAHPTPSGPVPAHEGHAGRPRPSTTNMDHGAHAGTSPSQQASPGAEQGHGAHGRGAVPQGTSMSGMDHSQMGHETARPPSPEPAAAQSAPGQPAATLNKDPLDRPAPVAIEEAERAKSMAAEMAGGGHHMAHGTYRHVDAGREAVAPAGGHEQHAAPGPRPSPSPDPHRHHQPAPSPSPTPKEKQR